MHLIGNVYVVEHVTRCRGSDSFAFALSLLAENIINANDLFGLAPMLHSEGATH